MTKWLRLGWLAMLASVLVGCPRVEVAAIDGDSDTQKQEDELCKGKNAGTLGCSCNDEEDCADLFVCGTDGFCEEEGDPPCPVGDLGCVCLENGDCVDGAICSDDAICVVDTVECEPGTQNCVCGDGGECHAGLTCDESGICVSKGEDDCPIGTAGCECSVASTCFPGLVCSNNLCVTDSMCPEGELGCPCLADGACLGENICTSEGYCDAHSSCVTGREGCECLANGTCDDGLNCLSGLCVVEVMTESDCMDAVDNDKDGLFDCADPDCTDSVDCSMCPAVDLCSDMPVAGDIQLTDENGYRFSRNLMVENQTVVKAGEDLTFDWSGVTVDMSGNPLDPAADIEMVVVSLWHKSASELLSDINDNALEMANMQGMLWKTTDGGETDTNLFSLGVMGEPVSEEQILPYFEVVDGYDPAMWTHMISIQSGTEPLQDMRMAAFFTISETETSTTVALSNGSAYYDDGPELPIHIPTFLAAGAGQGGISSVDWGGLTQTTNSGEFIPAQVNQVVVAQFKTVEPCEFDPRINVVTKADVLYRTKVEVMSDAIMPLSVLGGEDEPFQGINEEGIWVLGLYCTTCINKDVPLFLSVLYPCTTSEPEFNVEDHLLVPEPGEATSIQVELMCNQFTGACDFNEFSEKPLTEFTAADGDPVCETAGIKERSEYAGYGTASADGYFTELVYCQDGSEIVDLDRIPTADNGIAGTVIMTQEFYPDSYASNAIIDVVGPDGLAFSIKTDSQGRFGLKDMPTGTYTLTVHDPSFTELTMASFSLIIGVGILNQDLYFVDSEVID